MHKIKIIKQILLSCQVGTTLSTSTFFCTTAESLPISTKNVIFIKLLTNELKKKNINMLSHKLYFNLYITHKYKCKIKPYLFIYYTICSNNILNRINN